MASTAPDAPQPQPILAETIDAEALARAFIAAGESLRRESDALNAINVFPVPDGDTGTNMSLTMRAATDEIAPAAGDGAGGVAAAVAQGALMGAKGNSGVILSQILSGFSAACSGHAEVDAAVLTDALARGRDAAYAVISAPKEGTILTAITAAAEGARAASDRGENVDATLEAVVAATRDAVARTPDLLPVLREAGVVDAGAQGLSVFLHGMLLGLRGEAIAGEAESYGAIDPAWLAATQEAHGEGDTSGFCTEFVVEGAGLDVDAIRAHLLDAGGESLLVVGGDGLVRVHVHTHTPEAALAYAATLGDVSHKKVDDMEAQFQRLAGTRSQPAPPITGIAVVAVGAGDGIEDLLRSVGASALVRGGQTMNPSAGDIRDAIVATGASEVIVLPNNKNVVLAAEQAAAALGGAVHVLPTKSIPQGVAALIAMNAEAPLDDNIAAMQEAIAAVRTGEVTHAARATKIHGLEISQGQPIGLVDGDLKVAAATIAEAVQQCVALLIEGRDAPLVTLYAGEGEDEASSAAIADALRADGIEVELVAGGQPHYPYLIGVE